MMHFICLSVKRFVHKIKLLLVCMSLKFKCIALLLHRVLTTRDAIKFQRQQVCLSTHSEQRVSLAYGVSRVSL